MSAGLTLPGPNVVTRGYCSIDGHSNQLDGAGGPRWGRRTGPGPRATQNNVGGGSLSLQSRLSRLLPGMIELYTPFRSATVTELTTGQSTPSHSHLGRP